MGVNLKTSGPHSGFSVSMKFIEVYFAYNKMHLRRCTVPCLLTMYEAMYLSPQFEIQSSSVTLKASLVPFHSQSSIPSSGSH